MRVSDRLTGLVLLLFGVAIVAHARTFPTAAGEAVGAALFPTLMGAGLAACGVVFLWSGRKQSVPWIELEDWTRERRLAVNAMLVTGALVFYALAADAAGFFVTGFLFLAVLFFAFGVTPRWITPIAVAVTLGLHVAFYSLLRVPLPWGWLEPFGW